MNIHHLGQAAQAFHNQASMLPPITTLLAITTQKKAERSKGQTGESTASPQSTSDSLSTARATAMVIILRPPNDGQALDLNGGG